MSENREASVEIDEATFCARFKARMVSRMGECFDGGESIADYANETGPSYFDTDWLRVMGPEECADSDISYWEE